MLMQCGSFGFVANILFHAVANRVTHGEDTKSKAPSTGQSISLP